MQKGEKHLRVTPILVLASMFCLGATCLAQSPETKRDSLSKRILWKPFDVPTMGVQTLAGAGGFAVAYAIVTAIAPEGGTFDGGGGKAIAYWIFPGGPAMIAAFPASFYYGGKLMGGNGSLIWTMAGCVTGGAMALAASTKETSVRKTTIRAVAFGFAGTLFGYHLSASTVYASDRLTLSLLPLRPIKKWPQMCLVVAFRTRVISL